MSAEMLRAIGVATLALFCCAYAGVGRADGFFNAASMARPHLDGTATRLQDGRVFVNGLPTTSRDGISGPPSEIYDAPSDRWSAAAPDPVQRSDHTATLLPNGDVLVVGGVTPLLDFPGTLGRVDRYLPGGDAWVLAPSLANPRSDHVAVSLADGRVLVIGGLPPTYRGTPTSPVPPLPAEIFDPVNMQWHSLPGPATALPSTERDEVIAGNAQLVGHRAVRLPGGQVLVGGGTWKKGQFRATLTTHASALFDPATESWVGVGPLNEARDGHSMTVLADGRVLVAGGPGATTEIYDPATRTWQSAASLNAPRSGHTATLLPNGTVLVVGGTYVPAGAFREADVLTAEIYDPAANRWTLAGGWPSHLRHGHTATTLANGDILIAGGSQRSRGNFGTIGALATATSERYSLAPDRRAAIEYYHVGLDHYFLSPLQPDIEALDTGRFPGWNRTDQSFNVYVAPTQGASPVCRFYLPPGSGDSHFLSASPAECEAVREQFPQFILESDAAFYVALPDTRTGACPTDTMPVYRVWNARADSNHRYTTDRQLRDQEMSRGGIAEGYGPDAVAMCAPQHP